MKNACCDFMLQTPEDKISVKKMVKCGRSTRHEFATMKLRWWCW
jgi:hypothetical protein